jgi:hypothetical protein
VILPEIASVMVVPTRYHLEFSLAICLRVSPKALNGYTHQIDRLALLRRRNRERQVPEEIGIADLDPILAIYGYHVLAEANSVPIVLVLGCD